MAIILSLETSGSVCSVAIHENGLVVTTKEIHEPQSHASKLAVLIDEVIKSSGVGFKQLNAVAVSSGPGSYTGLRIGTSTAKGLCYSLGIPLISSNTLEVMCNSVQTSNQNHWLCPMIDARRMEVYCMLKNFNGEIINDVEAKILDEHSFSDYLLNNSILFFGDGAKKFSEIIHHSNAKFIEDVYASASSLGELAFIKWKQNQLEDLVTFEPFYLKEFMVKPPKSLQKTS